MKGHTSLLTNRGKLRIILKNIFYSDLTAIFLDPIYAVLHSRHTIERKGVICFVFVAVCVCVCVCVTTIPQILIKIYIESSCENS